MAKVKVHWDLSPIVCTGRTWQKPTMVFTKDRKKVTCKICLDLLRFRPL